MSLINLLDNVTITASELGLTGADGVYPLYESEIIDAANSLNAIEIDCVYHEIQRLGTRLKNNFRMVVYQEINDGAAWRPWYTQPVAHVNPEDGRNYNFVLSPRVFNTDPSQADVSPLGGDDRLISFSRGKELPDKIKICLVLEEQGASDLATFVQGTFSLDYRVYASG